MKHVPNLETRTCSKVTRTRKPTTRIDPFNIDPFDHFGISGACEAISNQGLKKLSNMKPGDCVITRNEGFSTVLRMLSTRSESDESNSLDATTLTVGCLGSGLPQRNLTLGTKGIAYRYSIRTSTTHSSIVSMELSPGNQIFPLLNCEVEQLFIPVFKESAELFIYGVYVRCPSIREVEQMTSLN